MCVRAPSERSALRDRIVCGIKNESTQKRLLADPELRLAKATDVAQAMEAADKGATGLKSEAAAMVARTDPHHPR